MKKLVVVLGGLLVVVTVALGIVSVKLYDTTAALTQSKVQAHNDPYEMLTGRMNANLEAGAAGCWKYPDGSMVAGVTQKNPKVLCDGVFQDPKID